MESSTRTCGDRKKNEDRELKLEGSCYCGSVTFSITSLTPYPYMRCYCNYCRKTAGGGGYGINIMAEAATLQIKGEESLRFHLGKEHDPSTDELVENENRRYFCGKCGSALWSADPRWAQWIYPYASSIDTALPSPPELIHIMTDFAAAWVQIPEGEGHRRYKRYPDESIADWHTRHGLHEQ